MTTAGYLSLPPAGRRDDGGGLIHIVADSVLRRFEKVPAANVLNLKYIYIVADWYENTCLLLVSLLYLYNYLIGIYQMPISKGAYSEVRCRSLSSR